jgi:hypothetical protein
MSRPEIRSVKEMKGKVLAGVDPAKEVTLLAVERAAADGRVLHLQY